MAGDQARRARQRAAKEARRKAVITERAKAGGAIVPTSVAGRVRAAASAPLWRCVAPGTLFETGIGNVILARRLPSGTVAAAFFLIDAHCLGVKDVHFREVEASRFIRSLDHIAKTQPMEETDPAYARKLVNEAAAYAADLGLPPPPDFHAIERLFGEVDAAACTETFTFGQDGKPLYVPGPNDTPARIRQVLARLQARLGPDGYHCIVPG